MRAILTYDAVRKVYAKKGYPWWTKPYDLNLFGVRSAEYNPNAFDDRIGVAFMDKYGNEILFDVTATTDPGTYYLKNLLNPLGCAYLKPGYYKGSHCLGKHKGYEAIVQCGMVTVYRIKSVMDIKNLEQAHQATGIFGINIHRAMADDLAASVDRFGAGCQVLPHAFDLYYIRELMKLQKKYVGTDKVSYCLLEEKDFISA